MLFGAPSPDGRDARIARRRFYSNAGGRRPSLYFMGLPEGATSCDVRNGLGEVVAYGHAGGETGMAALEKLREHGAACTER